MRAHFDCPMHAHYSCPMHARCNFPMQGLLEQLFAKFEVPAPRRSVADNLRLLDLLKKLATSQKAQPQVLGVICVCQDQNIAA